MTLPTKDARTGHCARQNLKLRNAIGIATGAALSSMVQVSAAAELEEVVVAVACPFPRKRTSHYHDARPRSAG